MELRVHCCRFVLLNLGTVLCWYRIQRLDEELYGGHQALLTEGFPPSMSIFLVGPTFYADSDLYYEM